MANEDSTDETLLAIFRQTGDHELLDPVVRRHIPRIRSMVGQMILNECDADDLTQEVFLRAIRSAAHFDGRARFSTWLYRIAMNVSRSYLERRGRTPPSHSGDCLRKAVAPQAGPLQQAVHHELEAAVEEALGALSPKLRAAIVLVNIEGLSIHEAAEVESCTRATMYWRIHEARRNLKNRLKRRLS